MKIIPFEKLATADLIVDAVYEGGNEGNLRDDPISKLIPGCGNQGGFRKVGKAKQCRICVLSSSGEDIDWPDQLDEVTGRFLYYGDNKKPGHDIHSKTGNLFLSDVFGYLHGDNPSYETIPYFLIFKKSPTTKSNRSVRFKGIAVPGFDGSTGTDDLIAIWKSKAGQRFQNYIAIFTVLDVPKLTCDQVKCLCKKIPLGSNEPNVLKKWRTLGRYSPLVAERTTMIRSVDEQVPTNKKQEQLLNIVYHYFQDSPRAFEFCAADLYRLTDERVIIREVTRGSVDGGRDAIGQYKLGTPEDPVMLDFALEAKCYRPRTAGKETTVGVKETSRLISRIKHRQFGVLVTTSVVAKQAYEEIREDQHPIIIISGTDITKILVEKGIGAPEVLRKWLQEKYPL
jgi:hypothetical protein